MGRFFLLCHFGQASILVIFFSVFVFFPFFFFFYLVSCLHLAFFFSFIKTFSVFRASGFSHPQFLDFCCTFMFTS